ncbi:EKC/KEOPS complex subunit LAGE3 [Manis javanica]|nr:Ekc/Keops Complex Subunit Lage3 [Manis pentadactyla]KAI5934522.1 EKC/KEOPS complex subunit LAGE3 [Manis javanica]
MRAVGAGDGGHSVPQAQYVAGPGGEATAAAGRPGGRLYVFVLSVPFPSPLEAEIARTSLASDAEPHRVVLHKELTVRGSILRARWRAADPRLLRVSVVNFLDQLSLVLRTLQRFGPPMLH